MKAAEVKAALRRRHGTTAWVCIEEAFSGFATMGGGIDLLAVGVWRSAKLEGLPGAGRDDARNPIVAYEVKVSRSDFRRELYGYQPGPNTKWTTKAVPPWPVKAAGALERSHYFVFAIPDGLLKDEEIQRRQPPTDEKGLWLPAEAGLVEVDVDGGCTVRAPAKRRPSPEPWSRHAVAELLRHVSAPNGFRKAQDEIARLRGDLDRAHAANGKLHDRIYDLEDRLGRLRAGATV